MQVRVMRMRVHEPRMPVRMRVRFGPIPGEIVLVPVVLVVDMRMSMFERLVRMLVLVALGKVQPDAEPHQAGGDPKQGCGLLAKQRQRERCTEERRDREVRARTRRAEIPQRHDEQNEADAISEQSDGASRHEQAGIRNDGACR